jgi:hypothetical protein
MPHSRSSPIIRATSTGLSWLARTLASHTSRRPRGETFATSASTRTGMAQGTPDCRAEPTTSLSSAGRAPTKSGTSLGLCHANPMRCPQYWTSRIWAPAAPVRRSSISSKKSSRPSTCWRPTTAAARFSTSPLSLMPLICGGHFTNEMFWARSLVLPPQFRTDQWLIWQYHSSGRRAGVNGPVDLNAFRESKRQFDAFVTGMRNT